VYWQSTHLAANPSNP